VAYVPDVALRTAFSGVSTRGSARHAAGFAHGRTGTICCYYEGIRLRVSPKSTG